MAGKVVIDVTGLEELEEVMAQASEDLAQHLLSDTGAEIRELLSTQAKSMAPVDTGTLRQMIDSAADGDAVREGDEVKNYITSHANYSIFVEYGTGYKGDPEIPHTSKKVWFQPNPNYVPGRTSGGPPFIRRFPQKPQRYMRPALTMSVDEIKDIIAGDAERVFER